METEKKKRGRPPKIFTSETDGLTYEGAINNALDKEVAAELDDTLANKSEDELTNDERKYLKRSKEKKSYTLNVRFTESEMQNILARCEQYGYKNKTEYIRDCVRARVDITPDNSEISETNRLMKRIGNNINQIAIRLHSTGHFYAEDLLEIKRGFENVWQLLLSIQSKQQNGRLSDTLLMQIRPTAFTIGLIIHPSIALFCVYTEFRIDSFTQNLGLTLRFTRYVLIG